MEKRLSLFQEVRDFVVRRGLHSCNICLKDGEGSPGFYEGAIDGFEACFLMKGQKTLDDEIRRLHIIEAERRRQQGPNLTEQQLWDWWYWRGYLLQLEFLRDRLTVAFSSGSNAPASAFIDYYEEILPAIQFELVT